MWPSGLRRAIARPAPGPTPSATRSRAAAAATGSPRCIMTHTQPGHARTRTVTGPTQAAAHIPLAQFIRRGVESHRQTATVTWLQLSLFIEYVPLGAFAHLLRASFRLGEARSAKVLRIVTRADLVRFPPHVVATPVARQLCELLLRMGRSSLASPTGFGTFGQRRSFGDISGRFLSQVGTFRTFWTFPFQVGTFRDV